MKIDRRPDNLFVLTEVSDWLEFRDWLWALDEETCEVRTPDMRLRFATARERLCWCDGFSKAQDELQWLRATMDWLDLFVESKSAGDDWDREDAERRAAVVREGISPAGEQVIERLAKGLDRWMKCLIPK